MLSKTAEYALRATVWLGKSIRRPLPADELARSIQVPRRYLHKVLQDLVRAGLVRSQSGPGGGYALARSAESMTILEVIAAVGPIERIRSCPLGLQSHTSLCPLHEELDKAYAATEQAFSRVTVAEVLDARNGIPPLREVTGLSDDPPRT